MHRFGVSSSTQRSKQAQDQNRTHVCSSRIKGKRSQRRTGWGGTCGQCRDRFSGYAGGGEAITRWPSCAHGRLWPQASAASRSVKLAGSWDIGGRSRERLYGPSIRASAERAKEARQAADKLACEAWNMRMLGYQGPAQPSPTIGDALSGGCGYLEVRCLGCDTSDGRARYRSPAKDDASARAQALIVERRGFGISVGSLNELFNRRRLAGLAFRARKQCVEYDDRQIEKQHGNLRCHNKCVS